MSAYIVFTRERTLDRAELAIYEQQVRATLAGHEVRILAAYGAQQVLEGASSEGVVIAEFPTSAAARAWYDGPEYRAVRVHRFNGALYSAVLVEGV
jgi:uncharacterized protein (DUF1330 family)